MPKSMEWHPLQNFRDPSLKGAYDDFDHFHELEVFLKDLPEEEPHCKHRTGRKGLSSCSCLRIFENGSAARAVAAYLMEFGRMKIRDQQMVVATWIHYAEAGITSGHCKFFIPFRDPAEFIEYDETAEDDNVGDIADWAPLLNHRVCQSAMMRILGTGRQFWRKAKQAAETGVLPDHGLKGKSANVMKKFDEEIRPGLVAYFEELQKFADPVATRIVRTETEGRTEIRLRNEETGVIELGPAWTKRHIYQRFGWERGHKITYNAKGMVTKVKRDDPGWDQLEEPLPLCAWSTFLKFWDTNYPKLQVRKPAADVCTQCFTFAQGHKTRTGSDNSYVNTRA